MKPFDQQLADKQQECTQLHAENVRLIALLEKHGISHSVEPPLPAPPDTPPRANSNLNTEQKIALFRRLFRGRTDVYPIRWEKKDGSKAGYAPACGNEWKAGLCDKKRVKCSECGNRRLLPPANEVIYDHLAGEYVVGVYPLLADDTCHFLAADFDEADWRDDTKAFAVSCHELGVPVAIEISFGKTVTAAALIARRGVSTLILVHRTELLKQWQERLSCHGISDRHHSGKTLLKRICIHEQQIAKVTWHQDNQAAKGTKTIPNSRSGGNFSG